MKNKIIILILLVSTLYSDFLIKESYRKKSKIDRMPKNSVADMYKIPQNPKFYTTQIKAISKNRILQQDRAFNQKYFKPWHIDRFTIPKSDIGWEVRFLQRKAIYTNSGEIIPPKIYNKWLNNSNMKAFNSKCYHAITIKRTDVKALPTDKAFYRNPSKRGEGFPFNYNQNSAYHINIPLLISHFSKDNRWAFVQGSYTFGWIKTSDLALVNRDFKKQFENGTYGVTIKDNLRLYNGFKSISLIKLGAIFPISKDGYIFATRDKKGRAIISKAKFYKNGLIAKKPLAFTPQNIAKVAKEFYGEPYGWGGGYGCRDCSATTKDFFAPFGIFLRRNSSKQAKDGKVISLRGLSKEAKKSKIIKLAKPFRSLLFVKGHIMLYIGAYKNEPIIMHTYWGLRKNDLSKLITARTIITSTQAGDERADIRKRSQLINTITDIINF